ncbi:MAG: hypothetical protein LBU88_05540 [Treponema sp.]|jgi:hypothetical protein|nr:hypothetical protein [Treponema sp.]
MNKKRKKYLNHKSIKKGLNRYIKESIEAYEIAKKIRENNPYAEKAYNDGIAAILRRL